MNNILLFRRSFKNLYYKSNQIAKLNLNYSLNSKLQFVKYRYFTTINTSDMNDAINKFNIQMTDNCVKVSKLNI